MSRRWTQMNTDDLNSLTERIIGCAFKVSNTLGSGFLEKVYENALALELRKAGIPAEQQSPVQVHYEGQLVGDFAADIIVDSNVIVELKAVKALDDAHVAQCLNYLKATGVKVCLLLNFGKPRLEVKRIVRGF